MPPVAKPAHGSAPEIRRAHAGIRRAGWRLSLPALAMFEAAARHLNFSRAARELGATQPAVSHHIAWLEAELHCKLFHRRHRGVALTPEGVTLYEAATLSRTAIERAQATIAAEIATRATSRLVHIATDYGFAGNWLIPHLAALAEAVPEVEIRITASQTPTDPAAEPADIAILLGNGAWPGHDSTLLFRETVFAVASAGFLAAQPPAHTPADLARLRLLHLESRTPCAWLTWQGWFAANGIERPPRDGDFFFNTSALVEQAAIAGQGLALGWHPLIEPALAANRLTPALPTPVHTDMGYYLVEDRTAPTPKFPRFRTWLINACTNAETQRS